MKNKTVFLVCHTGRAFGLGHLSRLIALAGQLKLITDYRLEFVIFGEIVDKKELEVYKCHSFNVDDDFENSLQILIEERLPSAVVLDLFPNIDKQKLKYLFQWIKKRSIKLIGIDSLTEYSNFLDIVWVPTFDLNPERIAGDANNIFYGWDTFLIKKRLPSKKWKDGNRILILTGGTDKANLAEHLPKMLDTNLKKNYVVDWVQGPFSNRPQIAEESKLIWNVHNSPENLDELISNSNYALTVFGLSFFEVLQYGIPAVVFSPYGKKDNYELESLSKEAVALVANNIDSAMEGLNQIINNKILSMEYSVNSFKKMSTNGSEKLTQEIIKLMESR